MNTNDKLRELIRSPLSAADGVTQADRDAAADFADWHEGFKTLNEVDQLAKAFARHRQASITQHEAERGEEYNHNDTLARRMGGRWVEREPHPPATRPAALAEDRNAVLEEAARAMESLAFFTDVDELRTMTKQEMSVRTCHEGAAAIRALRTAEAPAQGGE